jgi:predicted nucleotidyltransferase component of viral defense system
MNSLYKEQVKLLLRILPVIYQEEDFAVHGGTAINLFIKNLPRYSVDVDLTYIPIGPRDESLAEIDRNLNKIRTKLQLAVPELKFQSKVNKLICTLGRSTVKIEVNGIKRGVIGQTIELPLCEKAQAEFGMYSKARIVPLEQLYGGKIAAALSRQHPRDLFDFNYMETDKISGLKRGFIFALLGSDKPFIESLAPNFINQQKALENQFRGMTDIPFTYANYESARIQLIALVNIFLNAQDKAFLIGFEEGSPKWESSPYIDFKDFPSVQWKLLNITTLKTQNPAKHRQEVNRLKHYFGMEDIAGN